GAAVEAFGGPLQLRSFPARRSSDLPQKSLLVVQPSLALPPSPEVTGATVPPGPPRPAVRRARVLLAASPVSPETDPALDWAPELALESAAPRAEASPVRPESPERPETASPETSTDPLRAELVASIVTRAVPVSPGGRD